MSEGRVAPGRRQGLRALRERLHRSGAGALSDHDLLTLVLARPGARQTGGAARRLLAVAGLADLAHDGPRPGHRLGAAQRATLAACFELGRRLYRPEAGPATIAEASDVYAVTRDLELARREHFVALHLDARNRVIGRETVSVGTLNASIVHPREVFRAAIRASAASLVLVHNHPSGDPEPSADDLALTRRLVEVGTLVGIEVLDHLIIGKGRFVSLRSRGSL
ncbi:MAG: DNA repair protein RadC [Candidatus Eiseniibacteriota bacterium]|jgi:DNA repair protein RadC